MRLAAASGLARLVVAVLWGPSFSNDAGRYTKLEGGGVDIDWLGTDSSPAPLTQIIWHLPHDAAIAVQAMVSGLAWGLLAVVVLRLSDHWRRAPILALGALLASWTPMMVTYDAMPLPDSIAYSGSMALLAGLIDRSVSPQPILSARHSFIVMVAGLFAAVASQPVNIVPLVPLVGVSALLGWRARPRLSAVALGVVMVIGLYAVVASSNATSGQPEENRTQNRLAIRASDAYLDVAEELGMPRCDSPSRADLIAGAEASYSTFGIGPLKQQIILPRDQVARDTALRAVKAADCPALHQWTRSGEFDMFTPVLRLPLLHLRLFALDQVAMFTPFSPDERVPLGIRFIDPVLWLATSVGTGMLLLNRWFTALRRPERRLGWIRPEAALGSVAALSWFIYQALNWMAEPMDLARHLLPVTIMLPFLAAAFTLGRGRRQPASDQSPTVRA